MSIRLKDVSFHYEPGRELLRHLDVSFAPGEFIGVVGPNGGGKTTLARLLNGGLKPTSGFVTVDDLPTTAPEYETAIIRSVAVVAQEPENQIIAPTVWDEIAFGLETQGVAAGEIGPRCAAMLALCGLQAFRDTHPLLLSTGEQIRVLLAAALARRPRYLVLDEVYSALDGGGRRHIAALVARLRAEWGLGVVLLTHRMEEMAQADRILVLRDGRIALDVSPRELFEKSLHEATWRLEAPLPYQVYHRLAPEPRARFEELGDALAALFAPAAASPP